MKFSCVTIFGSHVSNCFKTSSNKGVASAWSPAGVVSPAALVLRQKPVMTLSGRMGSVHTPWKWDWKSGKEPHRDPFENARMSVVTYISMRKNDVKWKIRLGLPITSFSPIYCNGWTTSWFAHGGVRWKFEQSKPFLLFSISAFLWELNGTKYLWWFTHQIDHVQSGYMGASKQNPKHSIGESGPKKNPRVFPRSAKICKPDLATSGSLAICRSPIRVIFSNCSASLMDRPSKRKRWKNRKLSWWRLQHLQLSITLIQVDSQPSEWHDAVSWVVVTWCDMLALSNPNFLARKGVQNIRPNLSKCPP